MSVGIVGSGVLVSDRASEMRAADLFADVPPAVAELRVRPVTRDVRSLLRKPPERLARTDRVCQLAMVAAERALVSAGRDLPAPTAIVLESGLATIGTNDVFYRKLLERGPRGVDPKRFPYTSPNAAPGEIAIAFGLRGPSFAALPNLCGGLSALAAADRLLRHGRAASALVVGVDVLSAAAIAWLAATGEGIGPPAEGSVALVLVPEGRRNRLNVSQSFDPARSRSILLDPPDRGVDEAGDLPGAAGLHAIARAAAAGRAVSVEVSGTGGVVVRAGTL